MHLFERLNLILLVLVLGSLGFVRLIEPRVYPVITRLEITSLEQVGEASTRIKGTAVRLRGCDFIEVDWRIGARGDGQSVRVPVTFEDPPLVRPQGQTHWSGLVVGVPPLELVTNSYATVEYECWGPLLPRTHQPWYDGRGQDLDKVYLTR